MRRAIGLGVLLFAAACSRGAAPPPPAPVPAPRATEPAPRPIPVANFGPRPEYLSPRDGGVRDEDLDALWTRQLMLPVEGLRRATIRDDFTAKRDNKIHGALDLVAPRYAAVLAADDCIIGRLSTGPIGGIVIYATDPTDRFVYYYAHLQRYRRGLAVGDRVAKGSVIGYVGTTGNAPPNTPHLHFQVMKRGEGRAWWDGPPINPVPFFVMDGVRL